jgi:hypothetical protein
VTRRLKLEILEDRSVPTFLAPVDYAAGGGVIDVEAGDFNNDGRFDLVTANYHGRAVSVLLGNSDGTFQPARTTVTGQPPLSLAVGDFNQDGKLDLAVGNYFGGGGGSVDILLGQGDGTFALAGHYDLGFRTSAPAIATGDVNADGKLDLVWTSQFTYYGYGGCSVDVLLGHGDGSFGPFQGYASDSGWFPALALGDFDGDGDADVAFAVESVKVFLSNGDGTLQEPRDLGVYGAGSLMVADFDADGKLDLATSYSVLRGNGDGTFQPAQSFPEPSWEVNAADLNGDDVLDIVGTISNRSEDLTIFLGNGDGGFGPPITTAVGSIAGSFVVADLNADGRPDAATADVDSNRVAVLLNDGVWPPDDPPSVRISDAEVTEDNTGAVNATFTVTLTWAADVDVTVHYDTADHTAVAGSDYQAASGTLIIPAGQTTGTITVTVNGDTLVEPDETLSVNLSSPTNATIADDTGVGTILTDDFPPPLLIRITDVSKQEGKNGKSFFTFTITLSAPSTTQVTVNYATADGTARAGEDYEADSGTLTFAPGETSKTITIRVKGDRKTEANETFFVNLSGVVNALLEDDQGLGTILNDD